MLAKYHNPLRSLTSPHKRSEYRGPSVPFNLLIENLSVKGSQTEQDNLRDNLFDFIDRLSQIQTIYPQY